MSPDARSTRSHRFERRTKKDYSVLDGLPILIEGESTVLVVWSNVISLLSILVARRVVGS